TDFHQFMLYTPVPGTPLFREMTEQGRMLEDVNLADIHGQHQFNFRHAAISREDSKRLLDGAFRRDFERNGPSIYRICRTTLDGWRRYKDDADLRVRARFAREARSLRDGYGAALWAMERHLRPTNLAVSEKIRELRKEVGREFGLLSRMVSRALGPVMLWSTRREERRLAHGQTYEPRTIVERRNWSWPAPLAGATPVLTALSSQTESSGT
ncbi:MAG: B12-binding domain-containing radical SAM protein, partial [Acidobacteriia bacterium]|nr:B12-binding domain-containing radical SAM protein [Terriglobia bacterium]